MAARRRSASPVYPLREHEKFVWRSPGGFYLTPGVNPGFHTYEVRDPLGSLRTDAQGDAR